MTEEQKERSRQYQREYYQSHRQERIEKIAEWKKKNPEKVKEHAKKYNKKYYANNKDRIMQRRRELHTGEMVEVTRCRDCTHCYFASNRVPNEQTYACGKHGIDVTPDWYCADGERR